MRCWNKYSFVSFLSYYGGTKINPLRRTSLSTLLRRTRTILVKSTPNLHYEYTGLQAASNLEMSTSTLATKLPSVADFLKSSSEQATSQPVSRVVLGNPAGDADSLISAIATAYVDSILGSETSLPLLSIPLEDLKTQRPETKYLLQTAGISDWKDLVAVDDESGRIPDQVSATLVDHNLFTQTDRPNWTVDRIYDHHLDEGGHTDTCKSIKRQIAFDPSESTALVASTCTLIVERWRKEAPSEQSIPSSLALLLLGAILLDSVNLSPKAGKATERDKVALEYLLESTDWPSDLPIDIRDEDKADQSPSKDKLFEALQGQKFAKDFWEGLTPLQALRLDYKSFKVQPGGSFGVASILQPLSDFLEKPGIWEAISTYFAGEKVLVIMCLAIVDGAPSRQLAICGQNRDMIDALVSHLDADASLGIEVTREESFVVNAKDLHTVRIAQGNSKASRKQVAPILMDFFQDRSDFDPVDSKL